MAGAANSVSLSRRPPDLEDYIEMLRRRRSWIVGPTFLGLVVAVVVAFLWPDTYQSTALLRITPQQIPERLVPSAIDSRLTERLEQMETEILSRSSLQELIQRPALNLYPEERQRAPLDDAVQEMRNAIRINPVVVDMTGAGGRQPVSAFSITFSYVRDKYKAQAVVRELVTKFTEQNITVQRNQTALTNTFLGGELAAAKAELDRLDNAITQFKIQNQGRLPEQLQINFQAMNSAQQQLASLNEAMNRLEGEKMMYETQLTNLKNSENFIAANMEQTVAEKTVKNERLIQLNDRIVQTQMSLAASLQVYRPNHPNIKAIQAQLTLLEKQRDTLEKEEIEFEAANPAPQPQKVTSPQMAKMLEDTKAEMLIVQAEIKRKDLEIADCQNQQEQVTKMIEAYQARIDAEPQNEQKYDVLVRDYNLAKSKYEDMTKRRELSTTAQNLEEAKAGETLEVLDPASLPEKPSSPNRQQIAGIGLGAGLALGILLAGVRELKDTSLKNLKDVRAYTNLPILSSVPLLENALLVRRRRRFFWLAWSSAVIIGILVMGTSMSYYYFGHT